MLVFNSTCVTTLGTTSIIGKLLHLQSKIKEIGLQKKMFEWGMKLTLP
jgi:hypothetical protein